jgi:biopolymer transport protein ExbB
MVVLAACSVLSVAIIAERMFYFWRQSRVKRPEFMEQLAGPLKRGNVGQAQETAEKVNTPFSRVACAGLKLFGDDEALISSAMDRQTTIETNKLEKHTAITGTIGSVAVYIGLFGTVLGIIRAFRDISMNGSGELNVVVNGIAEALICTAAGLVVAVPAVVFYNYFTKRINDFIADMELCASETIDLMKGRRK